VDRLRYIPRVLHHIALPVVESAPVIPTPLEFKFPTMIFSHGLGGTRLAYSQFCGSMAANGMVVIVPEHRDGSCPVTFITDSSEPAEDTEKVSGDKPKAEPGATEASAKNAAKTKPHERVQVEYKRYPHIVSRKTAEGRNRQLEIRAWELSLIYSAIAKIDAGNIPASTEMFEADVPKRDGLLGSLANKLDIRTPGRLVLAGHSFGAATMIHLMKTVFYESQIPITDPQIFIPASTSHSETIMPLNKQITAETPLVLLDLWCLPMLSKHLHPLWKLPIPQIAAKNPKSILVVMSEEFFVWKENMRCVKRILGPDPGRVRGTPEHKVYEMWDTPEGQRKDTEAPDFEPEDDDPRLSTGDQIVADARKSGASTPRNDSKTEPYPRMYYVTGAAHLSQSDFGVLFPRAVKTGVKHEETLDLNIRAACQWLREYGRLEHEEDGEIFEGTPDRWVRIENDPE
jgi:platelet-activating factor acetylhydrolase